MTLIQGLGLSIPPVQKSDAKHYSSLDHLYNCISYPTVKDDIILVTVDAGDKLPSQTLNLHIFDSDANDLRIKKGLSQSFELLFTNLNSPNQFDVNNNLVKKSKILNKLNLGLNTHKSNQANNQRTQEVLNSHKGKSLIYICFDNLYNDKSWSFKPQFHDVQVSVDIKNITTIKQTNYKNYAKYFQMHQKSKLKEDNSPTRDEIINHLQNFNEDDFDNKIQFIESELNIIIENLKNSEIMLSNLMEQEFKLRDINESIYSRYTLLSAILVSAICLFGLFQIVYFKCYLKKTKVL